MINRIIIYLWSHHFENPTTLKNIPQVPQVENLEPICTKYAYSDHINVMSPIIAKAYTAVHVNGIISRKISQTTVCGHIRNNSSVVPGTKTFCSRLRYRPSWCAERIWLKYTVYDWWPTPQYGYVVVRLPRTSTLYNANLHYWTAKHIVWRVFARDRLIYGDSVCISSCCGRMGWTCDGEYSTNVFFIISHERRWGRNDHRTKSAKSDRFEYNRWHITCILKINVTLVHEVFISSLFC